MNLHIFAGALLGLCLSQVGFAKTADLRELDRAIQNQEWNEAAQVSKELLAQDPDSAVVKLKGAYALFQRNFSNSALFLLSQIRPQQWHTLSEGQERFAEVVALLQKKVPLNIMPSRM